jgi:hypothetical protein
MMPETTTQTIAANNGDVELQVNPMRRKQSESTHQSNTLPNNKDIVARLPVSSSPEIKIPWPASIPAVHLFKIFLFYMFVSITTIISLKLIHLVVIGTQKETHFNLMNHIFTRPITEIMFYIACIATVADAAIRSSGLAYSKSNVSIKMYKISLVANSIFYIVIALVVYLKPSIYLKKPRTTESDINTGNCSSPIDISPDFHYLCPTFRSNHSLINPVQIQTEDVSNGGSRHRKSDQSTVVELSKTYMSYIERFQAFGAFVTTLDGQLKVWGFPYPYIFTDIKCTTVFTQGVCENFFSRCRFTNCQPMQGKKHIY